jgi:hypothetical protein
MRALILAAVVAITVQAALAEDDVMAGFYGNTAIATGGLADTYSHFNPDHTFDLKVPAYGLTFAGTWKIDGGNLCRTFESPPPGVSNPLCTPVEAHKIGDTWAAENNGQKLTVTLVQGVKNEP